MRYDPGDQGGQYGQAGAQALLAEPLPYLISFQAYSDDLNIRKVVDMPAVSGKQCGGARPGAGRPPGHLDRKTIEKNLRAEHGVSSALASGVMPLDIILSRKRRHPLPDGTLPTDDQYFAAIAAVPFLHAKLSAVVMKDVTDSAPPPPPMLSVADITAMARKPAPR
jgi:hypothetical protein